MTLEPLSETMSAGEARIAIAEAVGKDISDRVENVGNSRAAVSFQEDTLLKIAFRMPNPQGDARDLRELTASELQAYIAKSLGKDAPSRHFTWIHLRAIYNELRGDPQ